MDEAWVVERKVKGQLRSKKKLVLEQGQVKSKSGLGLVQV